MSNQNVNLEVLHSDIVPFNGIVLTSLGMLDPVNCINHDICIQTYLISYQQE